MGHRQFDQVALLYEFSIETHIPADHLLRSIDRFVELGDLRRELAAFKASLRAGEIAKLTWAAPDPSDAPYSVPLRSECNHFYTPAA
jgi:hypothetical protein